MLNLAGRGFFSMDRWLRFSGTGAHLVWRVKNGARSVPFKTVKALVYSNDELAEEFGVPTGHQAEDPAGRPSVSRKPDIQPHKYRKLRAVASDLICLGGGAIKSGQLHPERGGPGSGHDICAGRVQFEDLPHHLLTQQRPRLGQRRP